MIAFIDQNKATFGVEPIYTTLTQNIIGGFITPSGYYRTKKCIPSARALKDQVLIPELERIHQENYSVYGMRKMWHALKSWLEYFS